MTTVILYLYSKYSEVSKKLLQLMSDNNIHKLCIDNAEVRKKIINSNVQITNIPCILLYHSNGTVQLYEGSNLLQWVHVNIHSILEPVPTDTTEVADTADQHPQPHLQPHPQPHSSQQKIAAATPIEQLPITKEVDDIPDVRRITKPTSLKAQAEEMERQRNEEVYNNASNTLPVPPTFEK